MDKNVVKTRVAHLEEKKKLPGFVLYGLIAIVVLALVAIGLVVYLNIAGGYVATVDGVKIGTGEFEYYLGMETQSLYQSALQADPNLSQDTFMNTPIGGEKVIEVAKKKALESARLIKIQLIKAKEAKVSLTKEEISAVDSQIKTNIIDQLGSGNKIQANNKLKSDYGFSIDDLRKVQLEQQTVNKFQSSDMNKNKVTDADIKSYYDKNPGWYKVSQFRANGEEAVYARHILIKFPTNATQADKDAAKKKAEDILAKVKAGEDFATLAKQNSEDSNAQYGGGYVFIKGMMEKSFEDAAFSLSPGQIYDGLVETAYGYHIIKLEEKYAKDQPVSLKCATEYQEYGVNFIKYKLYVQKADGWSQDAVYNAKINDTVYNSIKK